MNQETYHFIGIGGIGMSALARILVKKGHSVRGSDRKPSSLLDELQKEGIAIQIGHSADLVKEGSNIVISTAVDEANPELLQARKLGLPILHRSHLLDHLMQGKKPLLVTGTHGKTTTSALLACVLFEAKYDPSFVVGGIVTSLQTNAKAGEGEYFVAEADESDGSFLRTRSFGAIVTNCDYDHLDYWKTSDALKAGFLQFFSQVKQSEHLFWCCDDPVFRTMKLQGRSYGFSPDAYVLINSYSAHPEGIRFDLTIDKKLFADIHLHLWGKHNALNGAAVFALALSLGIPEDVIRIAFRSFQGTKRRLEFKGEINQVALYDDYGHHPTEIRATLQALRGKIGNKRLVVLFQPHRYSRVRDLLDDFCHCFKEADFVILTDIYSSGEAPIPGISTSVLQKQMDNAIREKLIYISRPHLSAEAAKLLKPADIVLSLGAGDITFVGDALLNHLRERAT